MSFIEGFLVVLLLIPAVTTSTNMKSADYRMAEFGEYKIYKPYNESQSLESFSVWRTVVDNYTSKTVKSGPK